jgi:hypothetical protein
MGTMPASDVAPLPRLGEVFFDVRGNSRTMRLSWYAETGVAVFSIWQGGTCTGTFRVPIGDLPRLVDALQRGPDGAGHAGPEMPGTGPRNVQHEAQDACRPASEPRSGGPPAGGPPMDGSLPGGPAYADYPVTGRHLGPAQYGGLASYGTPDRRAQPTDPGAHDRRPGYATDGYPEPADYSGPPDSGYAGSPPSASYEGAVGQPSAQPGPLPGYSGYPEPASYDSYPGPAAGPAADPLPEPGSHRGRVEPGYGSAAPPPPAAAPGTAPAAYSGYPDPGYGNGTRTVSYDGYPEPSSYSGTAQAAGQSGPQPTYQPSYQPTAQPGPLPGYSGYPEPASYDSYAAPPTDLRTQTISHNGHADPSYSDANQAGSYGGYPEPGGYAGHSQQSAYDGYPEPASYGGYPEPGEYRQGAEPSGVAPQPWAAAGRPTDAPSPDHPGLPSGATDPGPATIAMPPPANPPRRSSPRARSGPPYPPDPYLDGVLPPAEHRSP